MRSIYNIIVSNAQGAPINFPSIISGEASGADAIAYALSQGGAGASLVSCNKMQPMFDCTAIAVTLPAITATHGQAITPETVTASGGTPAYTFAAYGLPSGLSINASTGQISGTPAAAGTFAYAVVVTDANGNVGVATGSITVG